MAERKKVKKIKVQRNAASSAKSAAPKTGRSTKSAAPKKAVEVEKINMAPLQQKSRSAAKNTEPKAAEKPIRKTAPKAAKQNPVGQKAQPKKKAATGRQTAPPRKNAAEKKPMFQLGVIYGNLLQIKKQKLITAVICVILAIAILLLCLLCPTGPIESAVNLFAKMGGGKFPQSLGGNGFQYMTPRKGEVFTLSDNYVVGTNAGGRNFLELQHNFSNPVLTASSQRILVFNRESTGYLIANNSRSLYHGDVADTIYQADIAKNGRTAFITTAKGYTAKVTVYRKNMKPIFSHSVANGFISDVLLSDGGQKVVISAINVVNGSYVTTLTCFDVKHKKPVFSFDLSGVAVRSIERLSRGYFAVVCDRDLQVVRWSNGNKFSVTDQSAAVSYLRGSGRGEYVLACGESGSAKLYVLNGKGVTKHQFVYNEPFTDIAISKNALYFVNNDSVDMFSHSGEKLNTAYLNSPALGVAPIGSGVLLGDNSGLQYLRMQKSAAASDSSPASEQAKTTK